MQSACPSTLKKPPQINLMLPRTTSAPTPLKSTGYTTYIVISQCINVSPATPRVPTQAPDKHHRLLIDIYGPHISLLITYSKYKIDELRWKDVGQISVCHVHGRYLSPVFPVAEEGYFPKIFAL